MNQFNIDMIISTTYTINALLVWDCTTKSITKIKKKKVESKLNKKTTDYWPENLEHRIYFFTMDTIIR